MEKSKTIECDTNTKITVFFTSNKKYGELELWIDTIRVGTFVFDDVRINNHDHRVSFFYLRKHVLTLPINIFCEEMIEEFSKIYY